MTGTIVELTSGRRTGVIRAEDGSRIIFAAAAVLGDFDMLDVGGRVRFDVQPAWPQPCAVGVQADTSRAGMHASVAMPLDLRYVGFDQSRNIRSYRFDAVAGGFAIRHFSVLVDVALLLENRVSMQEAPVLCLRKLAADLGGARPPERHELGNDDLLAFRASREASVRRKNRPRQMFGRRRGAPPPAPWKPPPKSA